MTMVNNQPGRGADPITLCRELVRIPSYSGQEAQAADWAAAKMEELGFTDIQREPFGSVTGVWQGDNPGPTLLLDAHLDVAPVTEPERWQHPPFGGDLEDGRIWGRGSADTKSSLAAMLSGVSSLPPASLKGRVVLAASVQEETLTGAAVTPILERIRPDLFITGEPTGLNLAVAQKGRITLVLQTRGRSAHTSRPEAGENAAYKMIEAIRRLRQMPLSADPDLGKEILELTEIISAPYPNSGVVPFGCSARLIGRTLPEETRAGFLRRVEDALGEIQGVEVSVARLSSRCYTGETLAMDDCLPGWRNPPEDQWGKRILAALADAGLAGNPFATGCGTNASAAASLGIPAFIYGPGNLDQAHTIDEWVSAEEVQKAAQGFRAIVAACLQG